MWTRKRFLEAARSDPFCRVSDPDARGDILVVSYNLEGAWKQFPTSFSTETNTAEVLVIGDENFAPNNRKRCRLLGRTINLRPWKQAAMGHVSMWDYADFRQAAEYLSLKKP